MAACTPPSAKTSGELSQSEAATSPNAAANAAPSAPVLRIGPAGATTEDDLWMEVVEDAIDPEGGALEWRQQWFKNGFLTLHEGMLVPAADTRRDDVWELRVTVTDGWLEAPEATALAVIQNATPVPRVRIEPADPDTSADLEALAEVADADGDAVGLVYRWWRDGEETDWTERVIPAAATAAGEHWSVGVQALDGHEPGVEVVEGVTIANAAPRVRAVELGPEGATVGAALAVELELEDLDEDELALDILWEFDGAVVQEGDALTLLQPGPPRGTSVVVAATAHDGAAASNTMRSAPLVIENSLPSYSGAVLDPPLPTAQDEVLCLPEGWEDADGDAEDADIDWEIDATWVASGERIDLAEHGLVGGESLLCRAIPEDGLIHGAPVEAAATVQP